MKKSLLPALVALGALVAVALPLKAPRNSGDYDVVAFSRLPTLVNGRIYVGSETGGIRCLEGREFVASKDDKH